MKRVSLSAFEALESRTLLSVSLLTPTVTVGEPISTAPITAPTAPVTAGTGFTLNLTVGTPFTGTVAFFKSPVIDPLAGYSLTASISWGDGSVSAGTLQYGQNGLASGYNIAGSHTYAKVGIYKIVTTVAQTPNNGSTGPVTGLTKLIATINSTAIVTPLPPNSPGGVTIDEVAGQSFTAAIGTFTTLAPGTTLKATINWGDGSTSAGALQADGVSGLDLVKMQVDGTHTYAEAGTYPIHIVVTRPSIGPVAIVIPVATIESTAIVSATATTPISLTGTIIGSYKSPIVTPVASATPITGDSYILTGSGTAGIMGQVTAQGTIALPGLALTGLSAGSLTLTNASGSVTLQLSAPLLPVAAALPRVVDFVISQATGIYVGDTDSGTIGIKLIPGAGVSAFGSGGFTLTIS